MHKRYTSSGRMHTRYTSSGRMRTRYTSTGRMHACTHDTQVAYLFGLCSPSAHECHCVFSGILRPWWRACFVWIHLIQKHSSCMSRCAYPCVCIHTTHRSCVTSGYTGIHTRNKTYIHTSHVSCLMSDFTCIHTHTHTHKQTYTHTHHIGAA